MSVMQGTITCPTGSTQLRSCQPMIKAFTKSSRSSRLQLRCQPHAAQTSAPRQAKGAGAQSAAAGGSRKQRAGQKRTTAAEAPQGTSRTVRMRKPLPTPLWQRQRQAAGSEVAAGKRDRRHNLITGFPFPLGPFFERRTLRFEVVPGQMWTFEQPQNLAGSNVHTNVRMTAIKLRSGGLLIYAPIAPTRECVALIKELDLPVEYILLPTFAYEHKVYVGPFSRKFPKAQIYVAPEQWSFPLRLPLPFFGIFRAISIRAGEQYPWSDELDHRILTVNISKGIGPYSEVALFHKPSRSLLLVDAAVSVPMEPPAIIPDWALSDAGGESFFVRLLYGNVSKEQADAEQQVADTQGPEVAEAEQQRLGWMRMCLQVLFFAPINLLNPAESFRRFAGRLIVSPVIRVLVFSKVPNEVSAWIEDIASSWRFKQIIPCHFAAPVQAGPAELREAFRWAYRAAGKQQPSPPLLGRLFGAGSNAVGREDLFDPEDLKALNSLSGALRKAGVTIEDPDSAE